MFGVCFLWRTPPPLQESSSPDLLPIQRGRSDQGSTEKGKISSALQLKHWPQAEIVYCITCQRDWAFLKFLTDYFYIHRKDAGSLVPPHAQNLQFPRRTTKKVRRRARSAPRRAWLALATQPVCGHAGAPEQPWAPDEHVSTQTYRKQHSLCLSPFSHLDDVKPELNNKLLSTIALKREFEASELIWGVTSRVQRGGGKKKCCTGSIPHSVCADSREGWCGGWCVCPGTFLMAAGSQVGRQCRRCFENSQPLSAPHQTTEISHIIWHQMNNFDILAKKKCYLMKY